MHDKILEGSSIEKHKPPMEIEGMPKAITLYCSD